MTLTFCFQLYSNDYGTVYLVGVAVDGFPIFVNISGTTVRGTVQQKMSPPHDNVFALRTSCHPPPLFKPTKVATRLRLRSGLTPPPPILGSLEVTHHVNTN